MATLAEAELLPAWAATYATAPWELEGAVKFP